MRVVSCVSCELCAIRIGQIQHSRPDSALSIFAVSAVMLHPDVVSQFARCSAAFSHPALLARLLLSPVCCAPCLCRLLLSSARRAPAPRFVHAPRCPLPPVARRLPELRQVLLVPVVVVLTRHHSLPDLTPTTGIDQHRTSSML